MGKVYTPLTKEAEEGFSQQWKDIQSWREMNPLTNEQTQPGKRGMRARTPGLNARKKALVYWQQCNEERMLNSLKRWGKYGGMAMRIRFELRDDDGVYRTLAGKTIVIRKVPTQGLLLDIVENITKKAVEEAGR